MTVMCWLCDLKTPSPAPNPQRWQARRAFLLAAGAAAAAPALSQVEVGSSSGIRKLVPAETLENAARQQYSQVLAEARAKGALAPDDHPQLQRLHAVARRLIPHTAQWNARSREWKWQVNLIGSKQINAWCMPGGKIAFYTGILEQLRLNDDEVAMIMGHEVAHALREHARERMGKQAATRLGANLVSSLFGLGQLGDLAVGMGAQLLTLKFSRDDETEADLVGLELAARAGYNPEAGVTLWQKMLQANKGAPPEFMSTHPAGDSRIQDIQKVLPRVQPLYARAPKPEQVFGPPSGSKG